MTNLTDSDNEFRRARLMPKSNSGRAFEQVLGPRIGENILKPLHKTRGIVFPYTPTIQWSSNVSYSEFHMTHSNFKHHAFDKSAPGPFQMETIFTAQTDAEARYLLAVMHFLKTSTKAYFGERAGNFGGIPPPVLRFRYLGKYMFNDVPVIIKSYQYSLENGVDYVPVRFNLENFKDTFVPVQITISLEFDIQLNTRTVRKQFDLTDFNNGNYINKNRHWV